MENQRNVKLDFRKLERQINAGSIDSNMAGKGMVS